MKLRGNQAGFTLVEILVAVAMLGGVSLGVSKLMQNMNEGQTQGEAKDDLRTIQQMVSATLANPKDCKDSMNLWVTTPAQAAATATQAGVQVQYIVKNVTTQAHTIGQKLGKVTIVDMLLKNYNNATKTAQLEIKGTFNKNSATALTRSSFVTLNADIDTAAGTVLQCASGTTGQGDLWQNLPAPLLGIFYNQGSVLIGTGDADTGSTVPAMAFGTNNTALGNNSFAVGSNNNIISNADNGIALGDGNDVNGLKSIAIGGDNNVGTTAADGTSAMAFGFSNFVNKRFAVAIGYQNSASSEGALAFGNYSSAIGGNSLAIGTVVQADGDYAIGIGNDITAAGSKAIALGFNTSAGSNTVAIGHGTSNTGLNGIAIGYQTLSMSEGIALGTAADSSFGGIAIGRIASSSSVNGIAMGHQASVIGANGIAFGYRAMNTAGIAIGPESRGLALASIGLGTNARSQLVADIAIGENASANGVLNNGDNVAEAISIGKNTSAVARSAISIGSNASSSHINAMAVGRGSSSIGLNGLALGYMSIARSGVAIGAYARDNSSSGGGGSVAIGDGAETTSSHSIAIGPGARATAVSSIAIGHGSINPQANSVMISALGAGFAAAPTTSQVIAMTAKSGFELCVGSTAGVCDSGKLYTLRDDVPGWQNISDRNLKKDIKPVNKEAILSNFLKLDISTWRYKTSNEKTKYIGPMAQDFYRLFTKPFGLGGDDKTLAPNNLFMMNAVATQALNSKVEALEKENAELKSELELMKEAVCETNPKAKICKK